LGPRPEVDAVEISWPSGAVQKLEKLRSDRIITVKEGSGIVERTFPRLGK
jgi:hypothetical protein